jgi:DNA primase
MAVMEAPKTLRRIDPGDLAELGRQADFPAMLQGFGVAVRRQGANLVCAIRQERTPSCQIYAPGQGRMGHKGWTYWDFGSNEGGDVFDYLTKHQGMPFLDAVRYVSELTGHRPAGLGDNKAGASKPRPKAAQPAPPAKIETPTMPPEEQAEACRIYLDALCEVEPQSPDSGAAYLGPNPAHRGRNVLPEGWPSIAYAQFPDNEQTLTEALMPNSDLLIRAGLMKPADDKGPVRLQWGAFAGTLIWLAHHDEKGNVAGLVARRFDWQEGDRMGKYLYQRGTDGARRVLFGLPMLYLPPCLAWRPSSDHAGELLIVEGQLDALGAACLGRAAIALGGRVQASGASDTHSRTATMLEPHFTKLREMKRILVLPDNDADKTKAAQGFALAGKLVAMLHAEGCNAEVAALDKLGLSIKEGCKDLADVAAVREPA